MESYNDILNRMKNTYTSLAGYTPEDASDIGIRLRVLAGEIFSLQSNIQWLKNQMFPITATDVQLDNHAKQKGITRKSAIKSKGILTFSRSEPLEYDINIPKGTICSLINDSSVKYVTVGDVVLKSGTIQVDAEAEAFEGGSMYNTAKNTINLLITPPAGITAVTNNSAFEGGTDKETDNELRKRIANIYKDTPNGVNAPFYKSFVMGYDSVYSANVTSTGNGEINIYLGGKGGTVSDDIISRIKNDIENVRELNIKINIYSAEAASIDYGIYLTVKNGYVFDDVAERCKNAIKDYINSIGVGECIYLVDIGNIIYNTDGVLNYSFDDVYSDDYQLENSQFGVCGNIYISQRG